MKGMGNANGLCNHSTDPTLRLGLAETPYCSRVPLTQGGADNLPVYKETP